MGTQGISGTVFLLEGDFMPGPGKDLESQMKPAKRAIHIYPLTPIPIDAQGPFYQLEGTDVIQIANSDSNGKFYTDLPTGKYSILVKEDKGLFANMTDGKYLNPVEVYKDSISKIAIKIDHQAYY